MVKASPKKTQKVAVSKASSHSDLNSKKELILQTISKLKAAGMGQPSRKNVQLFSGNFKTKAGFDKNLSHLKKGGYVEYGSGGTLILTEKGTECSNGNGSDASLSSLTNESIQENMKDTLLAPKARLIFDSLLDGKEHDRKTTAIALGYDMGKLSGYQKDVSKMKTLGLLDYPTKTTIQLTDTCFPLGRP